MANITWVLESDVFLTNHSPIREAILEQDCQLIDWSDDWWENRIAVDLQIESIVFHGSLGNAARIDETLEWSPGAFCPTANFQCSSWYENAARWLVHPRWHICPAYELVRNAKQIARELSSPKQLFVRPDSPLKPFSGRVIQVDNVTLSDLDYGFYYEDDSLPIVAAPVRVIGKEWRFVIISQKVVAGSAYNAATRTAISEPLNSEASAFANEVAMNIPAPADVYVLDVCECEGRLQLLELNPFGGADLYACDANSLVAAISHYVSESISES